MSEKVKLSKDGSSIDFTQSDSIPTSVKKFRQSPEIEGFYRFIFENDLQKEALEILEIIIQGRKAKKLAEKAAAREQLKVTKKAQATAPAPAPVVKKSNPAPSEKSAQLPIKAAAKPIPKKAAPKPAAKKVEPPAKGKTKATSKPLQTLKKKKK